MVIHGEVNLGVAADTPRGLLVPTIKSASMLGLVELARRVQELIDTAREGKSTPADLTGGTITVTNIGVFGIDGGTPILNPGQTAILAMGRILDRPWVVDGAVVPRPVMQLSLSFDHRVIDGATGSRALRSVADFLADPALALLLESGLHLGRDRQRGQQCLGQRGLAGQRDARQQRCIVQRDPAVGQPHEVRPGQNQ